MKTWPASRRRNERSQQTATHLVAQVALPYPFSMSAYVERVAAHRGSPIFIEEAKIFLKPSSPCGAWIHTSEADFIFHAPSSSPGYVDHVIRHELGHMLWGHNGRPMTATYAARLFPGLDPAATLQVLGRESYGTEQERDAETFARLLAAAVRRQGVRDNEDPGPAGVMGRLLG